MVLLRLRKRVRWLWVTARQLALMMWACATEDSVASPQVMVEPSEDDLVEQESIATDGNLPTTGVQPATL
jgi:hypothetical protein